MRFPALLALSALAAAGASTLTLSESFVRDALQMRAEGDSAGELAHLRAAARADPRNEVALLELARVEAARGRPTRALELLARCTGSAEAAAEARALEAGGATLPVPASERPQRHRVSKLPRYTVAEVEARPELLETPFVLLDGANDTVRARFSPDSLVAEYPALAAEIYPHNIREPSSAPFKVALKEAVTLLETGGGVFYSVDASERGMYVQVNVQWALWEELRSRVALPAPFAADDEWMEACMDPPTRDRFMLNFWRMLTIGESGAGMYMHQDSLHTASWQLQLHGAKRWHLCSASESEFLVDRPDAFSPDYEAHPGLLGASCWDDVVEAGQYVYYPEDTWHQTLNIGTPSVALSGIRILPGNWEAIRDEMRRECAEGLTPPDVCASLEGCYGLWSSSPSSFQYSEEL